MIENYLSQIAEVTSRDDAREESFYSSLESLLSNYAKSEGIEDAHVTILPKATEGGSPDFRVWDGKQHVVGYLEAKYPGTDLAKVEESDQLIRYRDTFHNLILTDFVTFWLYRDGDRIFETSIGGPDSSVIPSDVTQESTNSFYNLASQFFAHTQPKSYTAKGLATELAKRTRFLNHVIKDELDSSEGEPNKRLNGFYEAFQKYLIKGLTKDDFSDLYAQTITYGLFAARSRSKGDLTRETAHESIPESIGILKDVFEFISFGEAPKQLEVTVEDIINVLEYSDVDSILEEYFEEGRGDDPIIHFYETFLSEYDPDLRERRGVYYTPEPVVQYIVSSVDYVLEDMYEREDGLANEDITVLDPAAGTLTFIVEAFRESVSKYKERYGEGNLSEFIKNHLLQNYYGFELMMAPYAIGHLKTGYILDELGYDPEIKERFQLYLTNTLEMEDIEQTNLPGMDSLSEESRAAGRVKKEEPILVVLGNPPYSAKSDNMQDWIVDKIEDYKYVDGEHFGEQKHWLHDDYVKFIRFAQWKIDQRDRGIVAFITNHGFLDNPTFRGMRQSLIETFDQIYTIDLHGNSNKKEVDEDGDKDSNVFDIQQGVAITIMMKNENLEEGIYKSHLRSSIRDEKYNFLKSNDLKKTEWNKIDPKSPFYFFEERDYKLEDVYKEFSQIDDIFTENVSGIITSRDEFVIDSDLSKLEERIRKFRSPKITDKQIKYEYNPNETRSWNLSEARDDLRNDEDWKNKFTKVLYRPFDVRHIFYAPYMVDWGRENMMRHIVGKENTVFICPKQYKEEPGAFVSRHITGHKTVSSYDINYVFPLYLYPQSQKRDLFTSGGDSDRTSNIDSGFISGLGKIYDRNVRPRNIMSYVYAIMYAPTFRSKYDEPLKVDFPRIPFPSDYDLFVSLASLGVDVMSLHLLESNEVTPPTCKFRGSGSSRVAKPKRVGRNYDDDENRVYINEEGQFFGPLRPEVWRYQIGGFQVLDKYLYDRREKSLSSEETKHFCKVATAIEVTLKKQDDIDSLYDAVEKDCLGYKDIVSQ